ncbi:hypothetical protein IBTHAUMO2_880017 [Nitrosopumilaceae archaeon]|nr:hypothetical protein IBTHAUMO2_880017 [Nitrosopumilaceae archaeon]
MRPDRAIPDQFEKDAGARILVRGGRSVNARGQVPDHREVVCKITWAGTYMEEPRKGMIGITSSNNSIKGRLLGGPMEGTGGAMLGHGAPPLHRGKGG